MKTNYSRFILAATAVLIVCSCKNEINIEVTGPQAKVFTSVCELVEPSGTKSTLNTDTYKPQWADGDAIGVSTAADNNVKCEILNPGQGLFDASNTTGDAPYYAVYPYSAENSFNGNVLSAVVPTEQQLVPGSSIAPGALVAAAVSTTTELSFKNCVSLISVDIHRDDISRVDIQATAEGQYLSGQFTMDMSATPLVPEVVAAEASQTVTLLPAASSFAAGKYFIAVLPGTISSFTITFTNGSSETKAISKTADVVFGRSSGVHFGNFFGTDITSADEFVKWAKEKAKFTSWDVVNLMNDIDMTGKDYSEITEFDGEFNGNDYTISGLKTPMFNNLYGYVHNLTLNSTISATSVSGNDYGFGMLAHYSYLNTSRNAAAQIRNVTTKGSISIDAVSKAHNFFLGGIVGCSNGAQLIDCRNEASVNHGGVVTSENHMAVGGIAGGYQSATGVATPNPTRCVNAGQVQATGSAKNHVFVGGCFGFVNSPVELVSCSNEGKVFNRSAGGAVFETGGVLGYFWSNLSKANLTDCSNSGSITDEAVYTTRVGHYMGGVVGRIEGSAPASAASPLVPRIVVSGCSNNGAVTMNPAAATTTRVSGIVGTCTNYLVLDGCTNDGDITSACASADVQAAGILAMIEKGVSFTNCKNHGTIKNTGAATSSIRIGGISGNSNWTEPISGASLPYSSAVNCENTGSVMNESAATVQNRIGGLFGSIANYKVSSCTNTGDISCTSTSGTLSALHIAGLVGCSTGTTDVIDGNTNNCTVSYSGTITTNHSAMLVGYNDANLTLSNNRLAGSFNGTAITAENFSSYLYKYHASSKTLTNTGNTFLQ